MRDNVWHILCGRSPKVTDEVVELHHVGQNAKGPLVEVLNRHNQFKKKTGGPLHMPDAPGVDHGADWASFRGEYWAERLKQAVEDGEVARDLFDWYLQEAKRKGTLSKYF